jgi:hypothetical protein
MKDLDSCCYDPYFIARTGALIQEGLTLIFVEINTQHRTGGPLEMEKKGWELGVTGLWEDDLSLQTIYPN